MAQLAVGATMGRRTAALAASNEGHLVQAGSAPTPTPLLLMGVVPNNITAAGAVDREFIYI